MVRRMIRDESSEESNADVEARVMEEAPAMESGSGSGIGGGEEVESRRVRGGTRKGRGGRGGVGKEAGVAGAGTSGQAGGSEGAGEIGVREVDDEGTVEDLPLLRSSLVPLSGWPQS